MAYYIATNMYYKKLRTCTIVVEFGISPCYNAKKEKNVISCITVIGEISAMQPFLKWPGGKRWFVQKYNDIMPSAYGRYIEPFLGGGAVFFHSLPCNASLSDSNRELINLYEVMRNQPMELAKRMVEHNAQHTKEYYYKIRGSVYEDSLDSAARFLYLNRTCYNGMYRVNRKGQFNVPIGTKTKCDRDVELFVEYSAALQDAELSACDFEESILRARSGDLVFVDPPYVVAQNQSAFINYNDHLFSWSDQSRLLRSLCRARTRGATIVATNANAGQLRAMYLDCGFYIYTISRNCVIASNPEKRNNIEELLITSYPINNCMGGINLDQNCLVK